MAASGLTPSREGDRSFTSPSPSDEEARLRQTILIVEDNLPDVFLIREALAAAGIAAEIYVAHDGQEATGFVDAADANPKAPCPDVILLDLNLPKKSGDEVLRHLRGSRSCRDTKVLIVTSSDSPRDRESVRALGATGYFRKPSDFVEFMKLGPIVRQLLTEAAAGS